MHVIEKISHQAAVCARTQTLHQGKASMGVKRRDINTAEKPHRNYTFFNLLPSWFSFHRVTEWSLREDVKGDEILSFGQTRIEAESQVIWLKNMWGKMKSTTTHISLFLDCTQAKQWFKELQSNRERQSIVSGWLTSGATQGFLLFYFFRRKLFFTPIFPKYS